MYAIRSYYVIQSFENKYLQLENKYFDQIFIKQSAALVDTIKKQLEAQFPSGKNTFFESHKTFRKANLDFALNQGKSAARNNFV